MAASGARAGRSVAGGSIKCTERKRERKWGQKISPATLRFLIVRQQRSTQTKQGPSAQSTFSVLSLDSTISPR